jgi:hypothetical protein
LEPRFAGTKIQNTVGVAKGPLIELIYVDFTKPFFSSDSKWSYGIYGLLQDEIQRLFDEGKEYSRIGYNRNMAESFISFAYGQRYKKRKVKSKYRYEDRNFVSLGEATTSPLPNNEIISATTIEYSLENFSFVKTKQIDKFIRKEDITLGHQTTCSVGKAGFPLAGNVNHWELESEHRATLQIAKDQFLFFQPRVSTWIDQNTMAEIEMEDSLGKEVLRWI